MRNLTAILAALVMLLTLGIASASATPPVDQHCPDKANPSKIEGETGTHTVAGVTFTRDGINLVITNNSNFHVIGDFCVKRSTYATTSWFGLQPGETTYFTYKHDISYLIVYRIETVIPSASPTPSPSTEPTPSPTAPASSTPSPSAATTTPTNSPSTSPSVSQPTTLPDTAYNPVFVALGNLLIGMGIGLVIIGVVMAYALITRRKTLR